MKRNITVLEKTGRNNKKKVSTFFKTNSIELVPESLLKKTANTFFEHLEDHLCFLNQGQDKSFIDSIDLQTAIEVGSKYSCPHLHALIKIL